MLIVNPGYVADMFVASDGVRLWTQRFGSPGDPAVLLIMCTSAQGIGWPDERIEVLVAGGRQVIRSTIATSARSCSTIPGRLRRSGDQSGL